MLSTKNLTCTVIALLISLPAQAAPNCFTSLLNLIKRPFQTEARTTSDPVFKPFITEKGVNVLEKALTNYAKKHTIREDENILQELYWQTEPVWGHIPPVRAKYYETRIKQVMKDLGLSREEYFTLGNAMGDSSYHMGAVYDDFAEKYSNSKERKAAIEKEVDRREDARKQLEAKLERWRRRVVGVQEIMEPHRIPNFYRLLSAANYTYFGHVAMNALANPPTKSPAINEWLQKYPVAIPLVAGLGISYLAVSEMMDYYNNYKFGQHVGRISRELFNP
jgi:hypothetical protein